MPGWGAKRVVWAALSGAALLSAAGAGRAEPVCENRTGTSHGYYYTFWHDTGSACITLGADGEYSTTWNLGSGGNMVAGKGWSKGSLDRVVRYRAESFDPGSNGYLTLYGWSTAPLIEYYVVDSWGGFKPPGPKATPLGVVESDGGVYTIYRTQRVNAPSIRGVTTFYQYWSVRTERRLTGVDSTITFANHVAAWRSKGMVLGTMNYQVMATEGFGSRGSSKVTVWQTSKRR